MQQKNNDNMIKKSPSEVNELAEVVVEKELEESEVATSDEQELVQFNTRPNPFLAIFELDDSEAIKRIFGTILFHLDFQDDKSFIDVFSKSYRNELLNIPLPINPEFALKHPDITTYGELFIEFHRASIIRSSLEQRAAKLKDKCIELEKESWRNEEKAEDTREFWIKYAGLAAGLTGLPAIIIPIAYLMSEKKPPLLLNLMIAVCGLEGLFIAFLVAGIIRSCYLSGKQEKLSVTVDNVYKEAQNLERTKLTECSIFKDSRLLKNQNKLEEKEQEKGKEEEQEQEQEQEQELIERRPN